MPQEPKRRHSRQRKGKRRASINLKANLGVVCPNCGHINPAHTICKNCGFYKGKKAIEIKLPKEKKGKEEEKTA